ncbi:hypothetical protein CBER1_07667 [Cercospora berteroae]|uniref:RING-type domain-containing protein n=1 Tax=Cercospora berteroae TaxID=357750 RepID=A0A2S6C4J8_9PEZI|nr:hypothetical protein CBER1_07667 [Cercospora berteroae]
MSKYLCGNNDCRYAHRDSVVAQDDDPRLIVLPGKLTYYLSKARIASKTFSYGGWTLSNAEEHSRQSALDERQEEAVGELRVVIAAGEGTMLTMRFSCSCELESCDGQTGQDLEVIFGEPLLRHSTHPQLGGQLAYLNDFIPTAIESEQSSDATTDIEDQDEDEDEEEEETSSSQGADSEGEEEDESKQDIDDRDLDLDDLRDDTVRQRAPLCPHCSKRNDYYSVSPCNHRTCIECALTLRLGRGDRTCIQCGEHADVVWFTASEHKDFQEMEGIAAFDGDSDILFENAVIRKDTMWLLDQLPDITVSRGGETAAFYFT